jgi:hypothetical protein
LLTWINEWAGSLKIFDFRVETSSDFDACNIDVYAEPYHLIQS